MTDTHTVYRQRSGRLLTEVANAMVALHKEQLGRGPTGARAHFAGRDILVCVLDDALHRRDRDGSVRRSSDMK